MLTNHFFAGPGSGRGHRSKALAGSRGGHSRAVSLTLTMVTALAAGPLLPPGGQAAEASQPAGVPSAPASVDGASPAPAKGDGSKPSPSSQDDAFGDDPPPPPDLLVLVKKNTLKGRWRLGVYGRQQDAAQPQVWRLKLWEQTEDRVLVSTDVLNCSPAQPMRITGGSGGGTGVMILRDLNPGGPITPANRLDHQVWWAACFPEQAGRDPATLGPEARRLGFSGLLVEREQVVPGPRRP